MDRAVLCTQPGEEIWGSCPPNPDHNLRVPRDPRGDKISWNQGGVSFGSGGAVAGAAIDPRTQLPVPHPIRRIEVTLWDDFRFSGIEGSALQLLKRSSAGVSEITEDVYRFFVPLASADKSLELTPSSYLDNCWHFLLHHSGCFENRCSRSQSRSPSPSRRRSASLVLSARRARRLYGCFGARLRERHPSRVCGDWPAKKEFARAELQGREQGHWEPFFPGPSHARV